MNDHEFVESVFRGAHLGKKRCYLRPGVDINVFPPRGRRRPLEFRVQFQHPQYGQVASEVIQPYLDAAKAHGYWGELLSGPAPRHVVEYRFTWQV